MGEDYSLVLKQGDTIVVPAANTTASVDSIIRGIEGGEWTEEAAPTQSATGIIEKPLLVSVGYQIVNPECPGGVPKIDEAECENEEDQPAPPVPEEQKSQSSGSGQSSGNSQEGSARPEEPAADSVTPSTAEEANAKAQPENDGGEEPAMKEDEEAKAAPDLDEQPAGEEPVPDPREEEEDSEDVFVPTDYTDRSMLEGKLQELVRQHEDKAAEFEKHKLQLEDRIPLESINKCCELVKVDRNMDSGEEDMLQKLVDSQPDMKLLFLLDEQIKLAKMNEDIVALKNKIANS